MTKLRGSNNLIEKHLLEEEIPLLFGSTCNEAFQSPITQLFIIPKGKAVVYACYPLNSSLED